MPNNDKRARDDYAFLAEHTRVEGEDYLEKEKVAFLFFSDKESLYDKLIRWPIYLLALLLPLFFLPNTFEMLEFNKQGFLAVMSALSLLGCLGKYIFNKRAEPVKSPINKCAAIFVGVYFFASLFSLYKYQSFIGIFGQVSSSFLSLFSLVALYYIIINNFSKTRYIRRLIFAFLFSVFIASLAAFLQIFGGSIFNAEELRARTFNTVGTVNAFGIFASLAMPVISILILINFSLGVARSKARRVVMDWFIRSRGSAVERALNIFLVITGILVLALDLVIDSPVIWVSLLVSMALLLLVLIFRAPEFALLGKKSPNLMWLVYPSAILVISGVFLFFNSPIKSSYLDETMAPAAGNRSAVTGALAESPIFGSGPGTFSLDYARYKPKEVNESQIWNIRFDRANSYISNLLAETGAAGLAAFLALVLAALIFGVLDVLKSKVDVYWFLKLSFLSVIMILSVSKFLYTSNLTLDFSFWLFLGLLASAMHITRKNSIWSRMIIRAKLLLRSLRLGKDGQEDRKRQSIFSGPSFNFIISFLFVFIFIGAVLGMFLVGQRYVADVNYKLAIGAVEKGKEEAAQKYFNNALALNRFVDAYWRNYSKFKLLELKNKVAEGMTDSDRRLGEIINATLVSADKAAALSPANSLNWEVLAEGLVYIDGVKDEALDAYKKAIEFEPSNPNLYTELAQNYFSLSESERMKIKQLQRNPENIAEMDAQVAELNAEIDKDLAIAEGYLNDAIKLKSDWAPAFYQLALVEARQGNIDDAISRLEDGKAYAPSDIGLLFQLGLLYYQRGHNDVAINYFEQVLALRPDHANAMWYLADIYEKQNRVAAAIELLEKVVNLNPGNDMAVERLNNLKEGGSNDYIGIDDTAPME